MENNFEGKIKNEDEDYEDYLQEEISQNKNKLDNQEDIENNKNEEREEDDEDDRLAYTLITLDLGNLIHIFEDNNISFIDMLLLSKDDLIELQLEIFQRNRILNFAKLFSKYAKNYSIKEISDFFTFNKQFIINSSLYDKVIINNINALQNDMNNNYNMDNNNDNMNKENNDINSNQNLDENISPKFLSQTLINQDYKNIKTNTRLNNHNPKINELKKRTYNIIEELKKNKNIKISTNINSYINYNNNDLNQNNYNNKLLNLVKKRKIPKNQNINNKNKYTNNQNNMDSTEEYQKLIEKIGLLYTYEMNKDLNTKLNLIKNYMNNKGDRISLQDIMNINNDIDSMIEIMNIKFKK